MTALSAGPVVTRVVSRERKGSSLPVVADTTEGQWFLKLSGASQGVLPLVAEIIVGALAEAIGLHVPARTLVALPAGVASDDPNDELRDLLDASVGCNLGFELLVNARDLTPPEFARVEVTTAARVLWLDAVVQNLDRTIHNPNLMIRRGTIWCIDHGACLPFHHDWGAVTEQMPHRPYDVPSHLFAWAADLLPDVHAQYAPALSREVLRQAVAAVPDAWLGSDPARRREGYVAFLFKRLHGGWR
ncbi:HipA family kinase [Gemmatimonas sp.]|uniref:HipA family kinase n=1 Tax=Gemmatimonas sp. TaxID=1962908 RepID=UPI0033417836